MATAVTTLPSFAGNASAISGSQFKSGRIIDDVVFFTANTMSAGDIQNFLNSKVPVCDTWHSSSDPDNQPPFTCLKDYRMDTHAIAAEPGLCNGFTGGNKTAAQIIHEVAHSCGVNPQVLLILLQKEQSLITDTWPWNVQYRSATGYACPDTASCDPAFYGFFKQVYYGARQYRNYAKNPTDFNYRMGRNNFIQYNVPVSCDGTQVYVQNQATAGLYNYTPYQPNAAALNNLYGTGDSCSAYGNRNFWRMFNDWFGSTIIGESPSPLYKSSSTNEIFAIAGGKKHLIPSPHIMINYGLHKFPAQTVSDDFLSEYVTATTLTSVGKKANDPSGKFYLFDDGKRYAIDIKACAKYPDGSANPTTTWGIDCFNTNVSKTLENELVDLYTMEDITIPDVILHNNAPWKLEGGKKRRITDPIFVDVLGGWGKTRWMKDINALQPEGKLLIPDNALVKFDNSPTLYWLIDAALRPVPGPGELQAYSLLKRPVYTLPASFNATDPLTVGDPLKFFARKASGTYYLMLNNGTKADLTGKEGDWSLTQHSVLPDYALNAIPSSPLSRAFKSDSGAIFTVAGGNRYLFPTSDDFFYLGYNAGEIQPVSTVVENSLAYNGNNLSPGRLFKESGNDTIRYVYSNNSSITVNSPSYPGLPYNKLITIDPTAASRYPVIGSYQP